MTKMIQLCTTKYSGYANEFDNCQREAIQGCEGCEWYVSETILNMFKLFEKKGFNIEIRM
jgi:hypothetical protein